MRAFTARAVRRQRDVRRPAARAVSRRHPAPARLRLPRASSGCCPPAAGDALRCRLPRGAVRSRRSARVWMQRSSRSCSATGSCAPRIEFADGRVRVRGGPWIAADLGDRAGRAQLARQCLGRELRNGQVLHAGFFLGPRGFYAALRELPDIERAQFEHARRAARQPALRRRPGAARPAAPRRALRQHHHDGDAARRCRLGWLDNGQVVSGVGGQYNFVAMAHALPGARSILCVRATRTQPGAHHLQHRVELRARDHPASPARYRDHRVRGRRPAWPHRRGSDRRAAQHRRLALPGGTAGARQGGRQDRAGLPHPGGVPRQPAAAAGARARAPLHRRGFFSEYPFGTDLTAEEITLARALRVLGAHTGARVRAPAHPRRGMLRRRGACRARAALQAHGTRATARPRRARAAAPARAGARSTPPAKAPAAPSGGAVRGLAARARLAGLPRAGLPALFRHAPCGARLPCAGVQPSCGAALLRGRSRAASSARCLGCRPLLGGLAARLPAGGAAAPAAGIVAAQLIDDRRILQRRDVLRDLLAARDGRSRRRMILPERVFGRLSAKRMSSGLAMAPSCSPTQSRSSFTSALVSPGRTLRRAARRRQTPTRP